MSFGVKKTEFNVSKRTTTTNNFAKNAQIQQNKGQPKEEEGIMTQS